MATSLGYVPIPDTVYQQIFASWKQTFRDASGKAVY